MKTVCIRTGLVSVVILTLSMLAPRLAAGTIIWSGASGTDTNWSNGNNWINAVAPGSGDDVKFFNTGTNMTQGLPNNQVDGLFGGTIASLQYGSTNGFHTTVITNGMTLNVTGANGLIVGTPGDLGVSHTNYATITGAGGTLNVNNSSAVISLCQGTATSVNFPQSILDLSGLGNFTANVSRIGIGTIYTPNPGAANQREAGTLYLALTNNITVAYSVPLSVYQTVGNATNGIELNRNPGNNSGSTTHSALYLGLTNVFNVDSLGIGRDKSDANCYGFMGFNPAVVANSPVAYFYGTSGPGSRMTWWGVGDGAGSTSSSHGGWGLCDLTGGTVTAFVNVLSVGRDASGTSTWSGPNKGTLTLTAGTIDANTVVIGNQSLGSSASTTPNVGILNVSGAGALLRVNTTLTLGSTASSASSAAQNTYGNLNVTNGTVYANNITVGPYTTSGNNSINLTNATLIVTNSLAINATGLASFTLVNSVLGLTVPANGSLAGLVKTLNTAGATNVIQPSVPVFTSYPQLIPLIQYTTLNGPFNFGLTNVPGSAPGAYLTNLTTLPQSVALCLPVNPRPVITVPPSSFSGNPGANVLTNFSVSISPTSVTPLSYQWYNGTTLLTDGPTGDGSTNYGSLTATLVISNAQPADNGSYTVVVTNIYGAVTSSPAAVLTISTGSAPVITGPNNQTVIQGNDATFTATVAANPAAAIQWQTGGTNIPGATSSTLVITNVQYPVNDQEVYSIIATNSVGAATNSATLTVIVPPTITAQPVNVVVTNTQPASLSVTVTGAVPPAAYQWKINGVPISPAVNNTATNATLVIASATPANIATNYSCTITNLAGATNTVYVSLIVNSLMSPTVLTPANGATGICYDTPLYITFSQPPVLTDLGKVRIYNVTNSATPVDTLDLTLNTNEFVPYAVNVQPRVIGGVTFYSFPVIITGNTAAIYPHLDLLTSNQTYYVTIDDGVFADASGAYFQGISTTNTWQFTTKVAGPANPTNLVVAADGSGDFLTVQGAVDSVPANNTTPTFINVRNGFYTEIVSVLSKNNLDFRGQTRTGAKIGYPNNNDVNQNGAPNRCMVVMNGNNCTIENITLTNTTPSGGSQAEAIDVEGTQCILYNMELDSHQDTFLVHSQGKLVYFQDSLIQGDTDFNWGYGTVFYTNCTLNVLTTGAHVTQPRSPQGSNGFSFVNCTITPANAGVTSADLGRSINTPTTPSEVIFSTCLMGGFITGYNSDAGVNFCDYSDSNLTATATETLANSTHLTGSSPIVPIALSATNWLYGWVPQVAPDVLTNPVPVSLTAGETATFTAYATGISSPAYQWLLNGTNAPFANATNAVLVISNAVAGDAGAYSVLVSNAVGSAVSSTATLTVITPGSPQVNTNSVQVLGNGSAQFTFSGTQGADYRVWATTNIALTPVVGGWTLVGGGTFGASPVIFGDLQATNFAQRFYTITSP